MVTFDSKIIPCTEPDEDGIDSDMNRIIVEVKIDGVIVWTKSVLTNDYPESIFGVRDELGWEAVRYAEKNHGYVVDEDTAEALGGLLVSHA